MVYIFCDNVAVVEVLDRERPKDKKMIELLQEFLFIVCTKRFTPIFRKIGTKQNVVADFLSRTHDPVEISKFLRSRNLPIQTEVKVPDNFFSIQSNW